MKTLKELKSERTAFTLRYNEIAGMSEMTDELRTEADELSTSLINLEKDIKLVERQEEINAAQVTDTVVERTDEVDVATAFRSFIQDGVAPEQFRGSAPNRFLLRGVLQTTTNADGQTKTVEPGLVIAKSPALSVLQGIGVKMATGLVGTYTESGMAAVTAGTVAETVTVADASATPYSNTLTAKRSGAYNIVTKEQLAQTNPMVFQDIIQSIVDGIWLDVANKVFDNLETDAAASATTIAGSTLGYADFVALQAAVDADVVSDAYVTTRAVAAYTKGLASIASVEGPVWKGRLQEGTVDGIPAFGTNRANANSLYYGDFSKLTVGQWGDIEIIVDNLTLAPVGEIKVIANGMFDSGVVNPNFFSFIADVSIA